MRIASLFVLLFAAALARDAYVCEVMMPNFDDSVARPLMTLGGSTFDLTDNFNVISFDGFYAPSGDIEGRAAIRNNLNLPLGQYSFGYELQTGGVSALDNHLPYSLIVGHDAVWMGGALYPAGDNLPYPGAREDMFVGGALAATADLTARRTGGPGNVDAAFDNARAYYTALQNAFAAVPDNAQFNVQWGGITITCPNAVGTSWSITVDAAQFNTITSWYVVGCHAESQIVLNINGNGNVIFGGNNIYHRQERVLYNVLGSGRTVTVQTEVRGSILAPNNQYNQPGMGVVKGLVIVANAQQVHQINRVNCVRPAPDTTHLCPGFETDCAGLTMTLGGRTFSFRDFNTISFGDFNAATGDIEGRLAARGNVNLGAGYSIGYELQTVNNQPDNSLPYSLVAGGDVTWTSGALFPSGTGIPHAGAREDMFVGSSSFTGSDDLRERATGSCGAAGAGCLDAAFDAAKTCYQGYSATAAAKADNVAKNFQWTGLFVTCNDATETEYVISLTPFELSSFTYTVTSNCNFNAEWIINVRGTEDVTLTGDSWPAIPGGTIYNIIGDRTVNVYSTSVTGHLLAPDATLNQASGVIIGKVVANNIVASLQINKQNTCPVIVTVRLPIVAAAAAQQGSTEVTVVGASTFIVGDVTTLGTIVAINGDVVTFSTPLARPVSAGAFVGYASVESNNGRAFVANPTEETSSASVVGVTVAAFVIAALAL